MDNIQDLAEDLGYKDRTQQGDDLDRKERNITHFYEAKEAKVFFDNQFSRVIKAMEDISASMRQKPQTITIPVEVPENYLEELFYGNMEIGVFSNKKGTSRGTREIIMLQDDLKSELTKEQWDKILKYGSLVNERELEEVSRMFQHGFRLAVSLIVAGLQNPQM